MEAVRYLIAALACGLIAVFASENLFWAAPRDGFSMVELAGAWAFYSAGCACALSAVAWTGCGGWRGLFLGGAILGFVVEGVIVDTMYDGFPLQLVWTPLAWHALLSALLIGGAARLAGWRGLALVVLGGAVCGAFALYWPIERGAMPPAAVTVAYILGAGVALPLGHGVLNRLASVPRPHGLMLAVIPALIGALWLYKLSLAPLPQKAALPVMAGLTLWAMARLGSGGPVGLGAPPGPARLAATLLVPVVMLAIALPGWALFPAGVAVNVPFALVSGLFGLGLWLWLLACAVRQSSARSA
jgi:hypothetical protein